MTDSPASSRISGLHKMSPTERLAEVARQCYGSGGFSTSSSGSEMIAQIQLVNVSNPHAARIRILERRAEISQICDACDPMLVKLGGGFRDLHVRVIDSQGGPMVITHLIIDTRDAMGANAVNTMAERLAPSIEQWTGGKVYLRILSDLADRRLARAQRPDGAGAGEAIGAAAVWRRRARPVACRCSPSLLGCARPQSLRSRFFSLDPRSPCSRSRSPWALRWQEAQFSKVVIPSFTCLERMRSA